MATGSFETGNRGVVRHVTKEQRNDFLNGDAAALESGTEVSLLGANQVHKRAVGEPLAGIVVKRAETGEQVVIAVPYIAILRVATSETLAAGANPVPSGTILADGRPQYVAGASGNLSHAICLTASGGTADEEIFIGILPSPVTLP